MSDVNEQTAVESVASVYQKGLEHGRLTKQLIEELLSPYPDSWIKWIPYGYSDGNKLFSPYVSGTHTLIKLTKAIGPGNWEFTISNETIIPVTVEDVINSDGAIKPSQIGLPLFASVTGCFSAFGLGKICDTGEATAKWGTSMVNGREIQVLKNTGSVVKNARTDALKRAARGYGVGLYLWMASPVSAKNAYSIPQDEVKKVQEYGKKLKELIVSSL